MRKPSKQNQQFIMLPAALLRQAPRPENNEEVKMGMDLISEHGNESFNNSAWRYCLETAERFGWKLEGTISGPHSHTTPREWGGHYFSNDYQVVTDRDARALGEALLRAIAALTPKDRAHKQARERARARIDQQWPELLKLAPSDQQSRRDKLLVDLLQGDEDDSALDLLRRLADYALKGGFEIW